MKNFFKNLENTMAAAAFAEAGEFETAREMVSDNRRILLALASEKPDVNAFTHALNMCKRINVALEILHVSDDKSTLLDQFRSELEKEGVNYNFIREDGCIKEKIISHTNKNRNTLFVVVEASEQLSNICKKSTDKLDRLWLKLRCPLVVVSDPASA